MPLYKLKTYGIFNIQVKLDEIEFFNFSPATKCGKRQRVFERNPSAADYIPLHQFDRVEFTNVPKDAYMWMEEPNPAWASETPLTSPDNCGNWPCTAPNNAVLKFKRIIENGDAERALQIISNVPTASSVFDNCES